MLITQGSFLIVVITFSRDMSIFAPTVWQGVTLNRITKRAKVIGDLQRYVERSKIDSVMIGGIGPPKKPWNTALSTALLKIYGTRPDPLVIKVFSLQRSCRALRMLIPVCVCVCVWCFKIS